MSTARRMFEDPRNTYIVRNDDPAAFDKRFVNRPGVHREQQCCRNCAPVWQTYLTHDDEDPSDDNLSAYKYSSAIQVEDATGESDNVTGRNETKGKVWVEGPASDYKPGFISPEEWMRWQGVYWMPWPRPVPGMPNPPRWVRIPGERKMRGGFDRWEFLWCKKCETPLEAIWSDVLAVLPTAARAVAMVASYVPVFGTALSLVINTAVSLAEGESIEQSLLDGIGGALPEQPVSGMAFNAAVAIGRGERLDRAAIDSSPLDNSVKDILKVADEVVFGIATGQAVTEVMYNTIRDRLPAEAQLGMDYARRVINGENIPQMILTQAEQVVADGLRGDAAFILEEAKSQGAAAIGVAQSRVDALYNQYAAEFGYQMALDMLAPEASGWLQLGLVGGAAIRPATPQIEERFATVPESNVGENDIYRMKGENLISSGIRYNVMPVSDILKGSKFNITIDFYDLLDEVWTKRLMSYDITDAWRRGFMIAIGVCEGSSERGPGQLAVYHTLAEVGGRAGFEAGQAVQFNRTLSGDSGLFKTTIAKADQPSDAAPLAKKEGGAVSAITNNVRRW
jgi:hypothetical protein